MTETSTTSTIESRRAEQLDDFGLASEVSRHASVAARHLSYAEAADTEGDRRSADRWRLSSSNQEDFFLAAVDECRGRLAVDVNGQFRSWLNLFGATALVEEVSA